MFLFLKFHMALTVLWSTVHYYDVSHNQNKTPKNNDNNKNKKPKINTGE